LLIKRYLNRQILAPLLTICAILVVIFAGYSTARYLPDATDGLLSGKAVLDLVFFRILIALEVLVPITLLLSVTTVLGRMHADSEIIAMQACGFGESTLIGSVLRLSLPIALLVAGISLYARPWAYEQSYWLKADAEANFDFSLLRPGRFHEIGASRYVVFLGAIDLTQERATDVFIQQRDETTQKITRAKEAWQEIDPVTREKFIVLRDGYHYELTEEQDNTTLIWFQNFRLALVPKQITSIGYRRKAAPTPSLAASSSAADQAEFQWRVSTGFSTFLLGLLGIPLGRTVPRRGKSARVFWAVVVFAAYYIMTSIAKTLMEQGTVGVFPGIWWPHILLAGLLVVLLKRPHPGFPSH
jgi:lipopolysaccharide export system permease protein